MTTEARRHQQVRYSQPMKDGRLALPIRWDHREGIRADRLVRLHAYVRLCSWDALCALQSFRLSDRACYAQFTSHHHTRLYGPVCVVSGVAV